MIHLIQKIGLRVAFLLSLLGAAFPAFSQAPDAQPTQETAYRYLAIGNSITRHPICEYWWDEAGMAASSAEKDYVHLVSDWLREQYGDVETVIANFVEWETTKTKKENTYGVIDPYLEQGADLITVQLSENATYSKSFRKSYKALIRHIQSKCPDAVIILVDDFWDNDKAAAKQQVAKELHLPFATLAGIRGDSRYQWTVGDTVYGSDGAAHVIEREDVAHHPNDAGMAYIAAVVIGQLSLLMP
mgnify:CR=1 FL=1